MARPQVVVDASVAVKWFSEEENSPQALQLRESFLEGRISLVAPDLLPYEVLNALRSSPDRTVEEVSEIAQSLEGHGLSYLRLEGEYAEKSVVNSYKYGISVYDASYLTLGEVLGSTVYTSDERMLSKVDDPRLRHIRDYTG